MTRSKNLSNIAIVVIGVTSILNLFWVVRTYMQRYESTAATVAAGGSPPFLNQSIVGRDLMIAAALIIAALCIASKRWLGLLLSIIALMWVLFEYIRWYFWTKKLLENLELTRIPPGVPQAAHLWGATTWNVAVLIIVAILVIWEIVILVGILKSSLYSSNSVSSDQ